MPSSDRGDVASEVRMGSPRSPLFGASDEGAAGAAVVASLIGGAVVWTANWYATRKDKRRREAIEDEATAISRLEALNSRIDAERKELKAEIAVVRNDLSRTQITLARAVTWIKMLEAILERENIPHPTWTDVPIDGSDTHTALPEGRRRD